MSDDEHVAHVADTKTGLSLRLIREWTPQVETPVTYMDMTPFGCRWLGHLWTLEGDDDPTAEYCTICGLRKITV